MKKKRRHYGRNETPRRPRRSERERTRAKLAKKRSAERDIRIPKPASLARRRKLEADTYAWLEWYFPHKFYHPWTPDKRRMVEAIENRARDGGDQAIAGPRGEGKTTIAECVITKCILMALVVFPVILGPTQGHADNILKNIKGELETNERLAADYPEVCHPIRCLEGSATRARMQTCAGERTHLVWSDKAIVLPAINAKQSPATKGSRCGGSVLMTRGGESALRGLRYNALRPDLVLFDDFETRESANSDDKARALEDIIEKDAAGLGGPSTTIARVYLCTIINDRCLAAKYTDPMLKPSWRGERFKLMRQKPSREDLWDEYMTLRQRGGQTKEDPDGRRAHALYLAKRREMDAGAEVSNPHRFSTKKLADGSMVEVSALQHIYNLIADRGWDAFATEYQNDPPKSQKAADSGLTALTVRSAWNGRKRGMIPNDAAAVTGFIDVGKYALHYVMTAWMGNARGFIFDYGVEEVYNAREVGPEKAVMHALRSWRDKRRDTPYLADASVPRATDVILVDSGWLDTVVLEFIRESGLPFRASKGFGASEKSPFTAPTASHHNVVGEHWYAKPHEGVWLHGIDSDHWKRDVHQRFLIAPTEPGSLSLFGDDARTHHAFGQHIVAEIEREEFVPGKGVKRFWDKVSPNNHWLDGAAGCCAGANMCGVRVLPRTQPAIADGPAMNVKIVGAKQARNPAVSHKGKW